eukprot:5999194-Pleurochrysis_carterae.AAC.1
MQGSAGKKAHAGERRQGSAGKKAHARERRQESAGKKAHAGKDTQKARRLRARGAHRVSNGSQRGCSEKSASRSGAGSSASASDAKAHNPQLVSAQRGSQTQVRMQMRREQSGLMVETWCPASLQGASAVSAQYSEASTKTASESEQPECANGTAKNEKSSVPCA